MFKSLKLMYLRMKARSLVTEIYAEFESKDCGHRLTLELKPRLWGVAKKADAIMDRIKKLDPEATDERVTPMLEEIAK